MLTSIVRATKTHYAALQHRPSPDRVPLYYTVFGTREIILTNGDIQVKADTNGKRKREITKLYNRLKCMYPEANYIDVSF